MWPFSAPSLESVDFSVARPGDTVILRPKSSWAPDRQVKLFDELSRIAAERGLKFLVLSENSVDVHVLRASGTAE